MAKGKKRNRQTIINMGKHRKLKLTKTVPFKTGVSSISAQLKSHWRWSEVELSEVTSSEVTGNHVTGIGSHVTGIDRVRMCNRFPHFFLP